MQVSQCLNIFQAKKKYVSILRGCNFCEIYGFNTFLVFRKRILATFKI